jgi:hypothetical protein
VRADLYIGTREEHFNKRLFDWLHDQKVAIEQAFGEPLEWERLDEKVASRVAVYGPGSIDDEQTLDEIRTWHVQRLLKIKDVFGSRLSRFKSTAG